MRSLGIWNHPKCPSWSPTRLPVPASCLLSFPGLKKLSFLYETNSGRFPSSDYNRSFQNGLYFVLVIVVYLEPDRIVNELCQCDTNRMLRPPLLQSPDPNRKKKYLFFCIVEFDEKLFFFKPSSVGLLWIRCCIV